MAATLRILIPNYRSQDSFTDNVAHTLSVMGHDVRTMPSLAYRDRGRLQRLLVDAWTGVFPETWSAQERWAVETAREWQPDVVLALTLALRAEVLAELKRLGSSQCIAWWGDTPANMRGMGLLVDGWDWIFIKDAAAAKKLRAVGLNAELLHEAMNPEWHLPLDGGPEVDRNAVVVAGNYYGYRQILIERLAERGVKLALYGSTPPRWSNQAVRQGYRGRYIVKQEKSQVFAAGLACLNSTAVSEGDSLNCRAFEICGAGGLQLIENKPAVAECFDPGREVLTYDSIDEIIDYLERARRDPKWAKAVRDAGCRRAHRDHTYKLRLTHVLMQAGLAAGSA